MYTPVNETTHANTQLDLFFSRYKANRIRNLLDTHLAILNGATQQHMRASNKITAWTEFIIIQMYFEIIFDTIHAGNDNNDVDVNK